MEQEIRDRYDESVLSAALDRYALAADDVRPLDGFESYIYEVTDPARPLILRIGHSLRRTPELIHAEVDWINYLADHGVGVAAALPSADGHLVEQLPDGRGGFFLATVFEKAPGGPPSAANGTWGPALFANYGRTLGRMHALSQKYQPTHPTWRRPEWDDPLNIETLQWLPCGSTVVAKRFQAVIAHLRGLPRDGASYGLIHQDAHGGNFYVDEDLQITLFDFDDAVYGWFAYDLAMVLFYALIDADDPATAGRTFWRAFWPAYRRENNLDPRWLAELPWFFKWREIDLYAIIHRSYEVESIADSWAGRFMAGRKMLIEQDVPTLPLDFAALARESDEAAGG